MISKRTIPYIYDQINKEFVWTTFLPILDPIPVLVEDGEIENTSGAYQFLKGYVDMGNAEYTHQQEMLTEYLAQ